MKKRVIFVAAIFVLILIVSIPILVSAPLRLYSGTYIILYTDNYNCIWNLQRTIILYTYIILYSTISRVYNDKTDIQY